MRAHGGPRRDPRQAEADAIAGRGGDEIAEGDGAVDANTIFSGVGDDFIAVDDLDATRDVVGCGPGKDTVLLDPDDEAKHGERINPT